MKKLIQIRRKLHQLAELSEQEEKTAKEIKEQIKLSNPDKILEKMGGHGIAAIYNQNESTKTIMFRAELDALPIAENNYIEHKSLNDNVSHKCGHDGHMTILLGLAQEINELVENTDCQIVLLFQPAEEIAKGALSVLNDDKFHDIRPDYIIGFHNLPGYPLHTLVLKEGIFASASIGMTVKLFGSTSHAGHPEDGNSPVLAMTNIIQALLALPSISTKLEHSANITVIHAKLGEIAFGTSPGYAEIMSTLRAYRNEDMQKLMDRSEKLVKGIAKTYNLDYKISWQEHFPATINNTECVDVIRNAARNINCNTYELSNPFPWSEDFGWYTQKYKGAFFGIGSGEIHPQLHSPNYDFPDEIIRTGIDILKEIVLEINK